MICVKREWFLNYAVFYSEYESMLMHMCVYVYCIYLFQIYFFK